MKTITIKFTNIQTREIGYFLRKKYKKDKRASLDGLCKLAVFYEIQAQAKQEVEKIYE